MLSMSRLYAVGCWALLMLGTSGSVKAAGQHAASKAPAVPMATYSDPGGDVSFDYPAVWKINNSEKFYLPPHILQGDKQPQVQIVFSPTGNYYAKTTLTALVFTYVKADAATFESCAAMATGSIPAQTNTDDIHGVLFQHFDTGDAGMCHGADQHIYWTYRKSGTSASCYLFEGDMLTSCSGAYPGQRDLTEGEKRALLRHLNAIPQSIRFGAAK